MAPTSDVRRDVAEQLRILRHITYYSEEVVENICDAINIADPVNTFREPEDIYECLADLIDPTCHIVLRQSDSDFTDEPHYLCSRCGKEAVYVYERRDYTLGGIVSHARYCSYCGARVVDE